LAGNTALLESVWVNDVNKAAVVVEAGANVLESNNGGDTVLHISALKGNADMTRVGIVHCYNVIIILCVWGC